MPQPGVHLHPPPVPYPQPLRLYHHRASKYRVCAKTSSRTQENPLKVISLALLLSILVLGCFASPASANSIPIQNFSFETTNPLSMPCGTGCAFNNGPIPGWTISGGQAGTWQPSSAYFSAPVPDGTLIAYSNGGTISQILTTSL